MALAIGLVLCSRYMGQSEDSVVDEVERILPRIQCAQCGYPGCRPYAAAIVADAAPLNLCPPGGEATVRRLAKFLGRDSDGLAVPATTACVATVPASAADIDAPAVAAGIATVPANLDKVAVIDEALCIGCNLCARACPVDAIVGVQQMMHTVISEHCTGCALCLPPCPVDCISLTTRHA